MTGGKAPRAVAARAERFRSLTGQIEAVNEAICDARPPLGQPGAAAPDPEGQKDDMLRPGSKPGVCWPVVAVEIGGVTSPAQHATMWCVRPTGLGA